MSELESRLPLARPVDFTRAKVCERDRVAQGDHPGCSRFQSERYKDFRWQCRSARRISRYRVGGLSMRKQCVGTPRLPNKFQSRVSMPRLDLCSFCSPDAQPNCLHRLLSISPDRLGKVSFFIFSFSSSFYSSVSCSPPVR